MLSYVIVSLGDAAAGARSPRAGTDPALAAVDAFTLIRLDEAPFGRVLAQTFFAHHPAGRFFAVVLDRPDGLDPVHEPFETLDLSRLPFGRALGGDGSPRQIMAGVVRHLLNRPSSDGAIFLQPRITVAGPLDELIAAARRAGVAAAGPTAEPPGSGAWSASRKPDDPRARALVDGVDFLALAVARDAGAVSAFSRWVEADVAASPGSAPLEIAWVLGAGWGAVPEEIAFAPEGRPLAGAEPVRLVDFSAFDPHARGIDLALGRRSPDEADGAAAVLCDEYRLDLVEAGLPYGPDASRPATLSSGAMAFGGGPWRGPFERALDVVRLALSLHRAGASVRAIAHEVVAAVDPLGLLRRR